MPNANAPAVAAICRRLDGLPLALDIQIRVGSAGRVVGIDPSAAQIARARARAARRTVPVEFQVGVIEQLAFPDQTFDAVLSTLMMHHVPARLKRQGLSEIARVLKPGGRLIIADFTRKQERTGRAARSHAGGSSVHELAALVADAGFAHIATEQMPPQFSAFPGAGFVRASKRGTVFTLAQSHDDSEREDHYTSHRHSPKLRAPLLAAIIVLSSMTVVDLHLVGGLILLNTGLSGLSLPGPLADVVIGLLAVVAVLKLTHILGRMHKQQNRARAGDDGNGYAGDATLGLAVVGIVTYTSALRLHHTLGIALQRKVCCSSYLS